MPIVVDPTQFNPSALTVPSVYLVVEPPQASITGAPASVFGKVGTASWGPVNQAVLIGSLQDQNINFGAISAASLTDPYDMATSVWASYQQASFPQGLTVQGVRVTDSTDVAATLTLNDNLGDTQTVVIGSGSSPTGGDVVTLIFTNSQISGSPVDIAYTVIDADTTAIIAGALKTAINANSALAAAGITATVTSSTITVHENTDLDIIPVITYLLSDDATETVTITAGSAVSGGVLTALYTGVLGNAIRISILPGSSSSKVNVLLTAWAGKGQEFYVGLPNTSAFWAALQSTLAGGAGPTVAASNLARFAPASSSHAPQQLVAAALSGGTDGRSGVNGGILVGSATGGSSGQGSGLYALLPAKPFCQQAACVGLTDMTVAPAIQEFGYQNGMLMFISQDINTTPTSAVENLNSYGIDNYQVVCFIDWCQMFDPVNNVARFVSPDGPLGGLVAALAPQNSPLNKQLQGVITTSRLQSVGPYNYSDVSLANTNGLALVSNPIGQGPTFGFVTAVNTSLDNIGTAPIEYSRMTNFIIQSVGAQLGLYLGANQLAQPIDPVRAAIKQALNNFFAGLEGNRNDQCSLSSL